MINLDTSDFFESEPMIGDGIVIRFAESFNPVDTSGTRIPPGTDAIVSIIIAQ